MIPAVRKMKQACNKKEQIRVVRRKGPRKRLRREKKREPRTKHAIEVRDLTQPYGLLVYSSLEPPSPTNIVFPGPEEEQSES